MDGLEEIAESLKQVNTLKPPISARRINSLAQLVVRQKDKAQEIVAMILGFVQAADVDHKLWGLYVVDAIVRKADRDLGKGDNPFLDAMSASISQIIAAATKGGSAFKVQVVKLLEHWSSGKLDIFSDSAVDDIKAIKARLDGPKLDAKLQMTPPRGEQPRSTPERTSSVPETPLLPAQLESLINQQNPALLEQLQIGLQGALEAQQRGNVPAVQSPEDLLAGLLRQAHGVPAVPPSTGSSDRSGARPTAAMSSREQRMESLEQRLHIAQAALARQLAARREAATAPQERFFEPDGYDGRWEGGPRYDYPPPPGPTYDRQYGDVFALEPKRRRVDDFDRRVEFERDRPGPSSSSATQARRTLFAGGLPDDCQEEDLRPVFDLPNLHLRSIHMTLDKQTGRFRGFAYMEYENADDAAEALRIVGDAPEVCGRRIRLSYAKADSHGPPRSETERRRD